MYVLRFHVFTLVFIIGIDYLICFRYLSANEGGTMVKNNDIPDDFKNLVGWCGLPIFPLQLQITII